MRVSEKAFMLASEKFWRRVLEKVSTLSIREIFKEEYQRNHFMLVSEKFLRRVSEKEIYVIIREIF